MQKGGKKKCSKCLLASCNWGGRCPASTRRCYRCGELGPFSRSNPCKDDHEPLRLGVAGKGRAEGDQPKAQALRHQSLSTYHREGSSEVEG